ncbi:hypothetical protein [uncultured Pedobacter sp.]|uniref:hypothetical protein n=1 Tax=uncultured Pedobacter sp. TaxID=246139 RepID=UPI0025CC6726|nr:hypothetical protein [uncultured Pedobacter sp.]
MKKEIQKALLFLTLLLGTALMVSSCKKNGVGEEQMETAATLKRKVLGKWELSNGLITYYGANGQVINQEDLSGTKPAPVWDFRDNDILHQNDGGREETFSYQVAIDANGKSKLIIDTDYDFNVNVIDQSNMKLFLERKLSDGQEGTIRRETMEIEFKKL